MFFDFVEGNVVVTEQGMQNPLIKSLYKGDKSESKIKFYKIISYIFFIYSKKSEYRNVLINDRKKIVSKDIIKDEKFSEKFEKNENLMKIVDLFNELQFSHKERLLEGVKAKIEEYLNFWNNTALNDGNHKLIKETLEGSENLLKLQDKLEKLVSEEALKRQVGGGTSALFENQ